MDNKVKDISSSNPSIQQINNRKKRSLSDKVIETNNKRRRDDLTCVICHGPASGYNFAQISCSSCKEFFRRTALISIEKTKCNKEKNRLNNIRCEIRFDMKQKCQHCRLIKCLESGMRKDHLITPEEKFTKQQHIESNRRIRLGQSFDILTDNDRSCLSFIKTAYLSALRSTPSPSSLISFNPSLHTTFSFLHLMEIDKFIPMKLINFLRLIPEFQSLNENDRLSLVKYNFIPLFVLHDVLIYNSKNGLYYDDTRSKLDEKFAHCYTSLCLLFYGYDFHQLYSFHLTSIQNIIDNDSMIIQLLMLALIFLKGASINNGQLWFLFDFKSVFNAHLKYTNLLFRYLIHRYSFDRAVIQMMKLIESIFKLQEHARFYQEKIQNEINQNEIDPIMKSLIGLYNY